MTLRIGAIFWSYKVKPASSCIGSEKGWNHSDKMAKYAPTTGRKPPKTQEMIEMIRQANSHCPIFDRK